MDVVFNVTEETPIWMYILCALCKPPMPYACVVASVGQTEVIIENIN